MDDILLMNLDNRVVVFDIDGTLADLEHRRHWVATKPKNWNAFHANVGADGLHEPIAALLKLIKASGAKIVLASGRMDGIRNDTVAWLKKHGIEFDALYMRAQNDYRKDFIIKVELLDQIRKDYGEPYLWFDDRQQVVDAIRAQGVKVLQVEDGNF